MNQRFFDLPEQRQKDLLNAGFKVFSQNDYDKAPMSQIAQAGGVSKSLLFHQQTGVVLASVAVRGAGDR